MTARLDQAAAEVRRRAADIDLDLTRGEVQFVIGVLLGWTHQHADMLDTPERWAEELHWLAAVLAAAGGHDVAALVLPAAQDLWDLRADDTD